ncbi:MAG: glycosyltransferase [Planctomycetes bacterium]|nr:glycosyltransferase [Planctomycetota bacterium]
MTTCRVAYILGRYPSRSETFIRREIEAVRRGGVAVDVYALKPGAGCEAVGEGAYRGGISPAEKLGSLLWAAGRPVRLVRMISAIIRGRLGRPVELLKSARNIPASAAFARRIEKSGAGCVHAHFAGEPAIIARSVSNLLTIPYTFSIHARDIFVDKPPAADTIKCARAVAACTAAALERAKELMPPDMHRKLHLVRHGVEAPPDGGPAERARERVVLMVGRLVGKKGVPILLAALKRIRDNGTEIECVILGDGPRRADVEKAIAGLGITGAVQVPGWADADKVRAWMTRASVLAVPSVVTECGDRDGLPNVILEAAAAGLPVVASDVGGIGEFISDGATGLLVPPGDAGALAGAIERMINDDKLRRKLTDAAREKVGREFDPNANAATLINAMEWKS